jgi:hypothetical protein
MRMTEPRALPASDEEVPYRTADSLGYSLAKASSDYWCRRCWDRTPKCLSILMDSSVSKDRVAQLATLELTSEEKFAIWRSARDEQRLDEAAEMPYNDMEIDILLTAQCMIDYTNNKWLELPRVGYVPGLKGIRDEWRRRVDLNPSWWWGEELLLLDPETRKAGLGCPSPPPLPAPWSSKNWDRWTRFRVWENPDHPHIWLLDDLNGSWTQCRSYFSSSSSSDRVYEQRSYELRSATHLYDHDWDDYHDAYECCDIDVDMIVDDDSDDDDDSVVDDDEDWRTDADNRIDVAILSESPRRSTLRSARIPPKKVLPVKRSRHKRAADPALLARTHGLTPDLSYRNRILVTEWALINVPRSGIHRAWAATGIYPFNPNALLDTLKADEDAAAQQTVARQTRYQEKKAIDSMIAVLTNPDMQAVDKFALLYTSLKSAMRANNWQQRSIFADSKRADTDDDDDDELGLTAYEKGGVMDSCAAQKMLEQEEKNEADLFAKKPYACQMCPMRYVTSRNLQKHILDKHAYPDQGDPPTLNNEFTEYTHINADTNVNSGDRQFKVCPVCGGNANHKANHAKTRQHKDALEAQARQRLQ